MTAGIFTMGALALVLYACGSSSGTGIGSTPATGAGGSGEGTGGSSAGGTTSAGGASTGGASAAGGVSATGGGMGVPAPLCTPEQMCKNPPVMGPGAPAPDGTESNIQAIDKLVLGDTKRDGTMSSSAWQDFGFAISGMVYATAKSTPHCKPQEGAKPADVIINGTNGVDNSFGKNIVPIVLGLSSDAAQKIQDAITAGNFSVLIKIDKFGAGTDYNGLSAILYASKGTDDGMGGTVAPPATDWSGYTWHPFDSQQSGVPFPSSYMVKNQWVSGSKGDIDLTLSFSGYDLALAIHQGQIAHTYAADHKTATLGDIGGILGTEQLVTAVKSIAGKVSSSLCCGSAIDGVLQQIRQASDIGQDGKQDPTKTCDGISIGLGYETTTSKLGAAAPPSPVMDACAGMVCP